MAQQMTDAVKLATSPYQYALSTRAGCECISHVLQGLTELDHNATVVSIDGISAFDFEQSEVLCWKLCGMSPHQLCPFVRHSVATLLVTSGKTMKVLSMRMTRAKAGSRVSLRAVQRQLLPGELVFAYLDDIYVITTPDMVLAVYNLLQTELWRHARIRVHDGKTQKSGVRPRGCDTIDRAARAT